MDTHQRTTFFEEHGYVDFGPIVPAAACDLLRDKIRVTRNFGPDLFLSEAEFNALNPDAFNKNPRPGCNLLDDLAADAVPIAENPELTAFLREMLGQNYEVLRRGLDWDLGTLQLDSEGLWIDPGTIGEDYGKYDPWLWRTEGADCPLPMPNEIPPAEVLRGLVPGHEHESGVGPVGNALRGAPGAGEHGGAHLEGLPPAPGIPLIPLQPVEPDAAPLPEPTPARPAEPEGQSLQHLFPVP